MSFRARVAFVVIAVLMAIGGWASAQVLQQQSVDPPIVLSGSDVGFRITSVQGDTPVGTLVVRVNGKWVTVRLGGEGTLRLVP